MALALAFILFYFLANHFENLYELIVGARNERFKNDGKKERKLFCGVVVELGEGVVVGT